MIKAAFILFALFFSLSSFANCLPENVIEGEYLVRIENMNSGKISFKSHDDLMTQFHNKFQTRTIHNQARKISKSLSANKIKDLPPSLLHIKDPGGKIADYLNHPQVLSIEENCLLETQVMPDDSRYSSLWAHQVIESEAAWDISTGNQDIIVAISDTGVDYNHEDLKENMWVNLAEKNGVAGVDDDNNGYIDDIHGYDFAENDSDPMPGHLHGTHVAGSTGAKGNNAFGVAGVVWNVKLMAVKGFSDSGTGGSMDALLETIYYATDNGARVVNCSWGGQGSPNQASRDAINYALSNGTIPVLAAGNSSMNASGFNPAGIASALTVGASTRTDGLANFSNFGTVVDVIAPGTEILSTVPGGTYQNLQGTSMAAPHVAGLAALVLSINPNLSANEVIDLIKDSGDEVEVTAANGTNYTYPRINALKAALAARDSLPGDPSLPPPPCDGESCDDIVKEKGLRELASFDSTGCSYSSNANSGGGFGLWFLLLPFALLIFKRKT